MHYAPGLPLSGEPIGPGGFIRPEDQEDSDNEEAWEDVLKDKDQEEEEEEEEEEVEGSTKEGSTSMRQVDDEMEIDAECEDEE